ncbi:MAG: hypothetical protein J5808_05865 [Paludibacteraceae bacterium]|nr:hypothetical protein [Paludibacteraceae bacterium]
MRQYLGYFVALCGLLVACKPTATESAFVPVPAIQCEEIDFHDSVPAQIGPDKPLKFGFELEIPTQDHPQLRQQILGWVRDLLGESYQAESLETDEMLRFFANDFYSMAEYYGDCCYHAHLEKIFENDYIISFKYSDHAGSGGYHDMSQTFGLSVLKADGSDVSAILFNHPEKLQGKLLQGLARYFNVETTDEVKLKLRDDAATNLPLPMLPPWVEDDGIHFLYRQHEIAPASAGEPECILTIESLHDLLCPEVEPILYSAQK